MFGLKVTTKDIHPSELPDSFPDNHDTGEIYFCSEYSITKGIMCVDDGHYCEIDVVELIEIVEVLEEHQKKKRNKALENEACITDLRTGERTPAHQEQPK